MPLNRGTRRALVSGGASAAFQPDLLNGLVAYWSLEEASGVRFDSHSTNHLNDVNSVTQATGRVGNAAQFTAANLEYLNISSNSDVSPGDVDFSFVAWVYLDSLNVTRVVVSKYGSGQREYHLLLLSNNEFLWEVSDNGSSDSAAISSTTFGPLISGTWYMVHCFHDSVGDQIGVSVNATTVDSAAHATGIHQGTWWFGIGAQSTAAANTWDGRIDEVGLWHRLLTPAELSYLYNAGSGRAYGDL